MSFDSAQYKTTTRQQWEEYASGWNAWAPVIEKWLTGATHQMLGSLDPGEQQSVWEEIETALGQFETDAGFVGPRELVIAGATR